jgi:lipopolysaccharide biosynthesis glycosyltransferase
MNYQRSFMEKIKIIVGFDQREAVAYHTFCQSVIENSSLPVQIIPLAKNNLAGYSNEDKDGSNDFIYSRFLAPYLCEFDGWCIFADGDMVCTSDIAELWQLRDESKALLVVKHDYKTKSQIKYLNNKNEDYPRKNWSSVILWNCSHPSHKLLTPEFIQKSSGSYLHRFAWLEDDMIGDLPIEWNWLAVEYADNPAAKLVHYTLGTPCFKDYTNTSMAEVWKATNSRVNEGFGK